MNRLAINAIQLRSNQTDGLNRYTYHLARGLNDEHPDSLVLSHFQNQFRNSLQTPAVLSTFGLIGNLSRLLWYQSFLRPLIKKNEVSLFYSPVPEGMMVGECPQIITIHDVLPLLYPEVYPRIRYYFRHILPYLIKKSSLIITVSNSTMNDVLRYYRADPSKLFVIYQGFDDINFYKKSKTDISRVREKYQVKGDYFLCVGETRPYKNITGLIKAYARLPEKNISLVIAGNISKLAKDILSLPKKLAIEKGVKFVGFIPDHDLACLYSDTKAFIFPSFYEGFGIPLLEAMACGAPILASNIPVFKEVSGNAAIYFDPESPSDLSGKMQRIINETQIRHRLVEESKKQIRIFRWDKAVDKILTIIENNFPAVRYSRNV